MPVLFVIFLVLFVLKLMDLIKYAAAADANGIVCQIVAWLIGIVAVFLAVSASYGDVPADAWPRIFWGVLIGSAASAVHDLHKALGKAWRHVALLPDRVAT